VSGPAEARTVSPPRPDVESPRPRFLRGAILAPVFALIFAGLFSGPFPTFWGKFWAELAGFGLAGWIASWLARRRGALAVAAGFSLSWGVLILATIPYLPERVVLSFLAYIGAGLIGAATADLYRLLTSPRRRS